MDAEEKNAFAVPVLDSVPREPPTLAVPNNPVQCPLQHTDRKCSHGDVTLCP